ncbi:hypothetical protein [Streptomyces sp. NPDC018045]
MAADAYRDYIVPIVPEAVPDRISTSRSSRIRAAFLTAPKVDRY